MRRVIAITGSIVFLDAMLFGAIIPLLPTFADDYDLSKLEAGALLGSYGAGALVGGIPGGLLVGRIGPKRGVFVGLVALAVASLGFALAGGPVALGIARFAQGLSSATTWAGALAWVAVSVPRERRGQALGLVFGIAVFGFVVGPMFGGVAEIVGIRPSFAMVAGIAGVLALGVGLASAPGREIQVPGAVRRALADRAFVGGLWLNTLPALFFGALDVLVPLRTRRRGLRRARDRGGVRRRRPRRGVRQPDRGPVSDRQGRLVPIRFSLGAAMVVSAAIAFATASRSSSPALVVAASIAYGGFYTPGMALVADRAELAGLAQGIGFGVMNSAWAAGALLGPALGGALAQVFGDAVPYLASAASSAPARSSPSRAARRGCARPDGQAAAGNRSSTHSASRVRRRR